MPYYITRESQECAGYAVVSVYEDQTELHGCHLTRQAAIDQMVAMSEEEGIEPGGDLDQIEESVEEDDEEMYASKVVRLSSPVRIISFSGSQVTLDAAGDTPSRTISGIAVPYNVTATVSDGTQVMFRPGALPVDGKAPKLFMYHDASQPVGLVTGRVDTDEGMLFTAKVSKTAAGDDALELAKDGVIDSVSVGVNPTEYDMDGDTMVVTAADWMELSLVPIPAFAGATITDVAASAATIPDAVSSTTNPKETAVVEAEKTVEIEAATPTAPIPAQPKRNFGMPTAGEYLAAYHIGGDTYRKVNDAFIEAAKSRQTALQAAAGDTLTTDTPGLLPVPVLGPVFDDLNYIRPVVAAVGARAMPDGGAQKTFIRPTWTTHPSVAAQSPELNPASATTPVIASNVVTKTTLAGQVTLSVQDIDFTSPGAMEIILRDLVGQYMLASDNVAADAITAGATPSGATWTVTGNQTDPSSLITALYGAAVNILSATNFLPDHCFVSPNVWELLGRQLDADKRPVFPYVGAAGLMGVNAMGTGGVTQMNSFNPFGLNLVADRNFAGNTLVVARGTAIEFYEQVKGIMSVEVPSTLGRTFSYYGYVATFIADSTQVQSIALA
jgi:HK97 family phage prohead protease